MKQFKRALCLFMALVLTLGLCGCTEGDKTSDSFFDRLAKAVMVDIFGMDATYVDYQFDPAAFVVFAEEEDAEGIYIPISEIEAYESQYPDCVSTWYRDQLTGEDRILYNAHLYAMEHSLKCFSLYVEDNEKSFEHVRDLLALDSPFLEQNINSDGEYTRYWEATEAGERIYFHIDQFEKDRWELKMQALEQCRKIVREMPASFKTQEEKMLYLYHYVCDQITYTEYEKLSDQDYLYDAAIVGKTVCDGYSNMLSLLFNLAGVDACEVMGNDVQLPEDATKEEIEENVGHTWVAAKLGEVYYHFDPTFEDTTDEIQKEKTIFFGVSDEMASSKYIDYDTMRPKCMDKSRDFAFTQLTMKNIQDNSEINALAELTDERTKQEKYTTYVLVNAQVDEKSVDKMLDSYVNKVDYVKRVSVSYIEVAGKTLLCLTTEPW